MGKYKHAKKLAFASIVFALMGIACSTLGIFMDPRFFDLSVVMYVFFIINVVAGVIAGGIESEKMWQ